MGKNRATVNTGGISVEFDTAHSRRFPKSATIDGMPLDQLADEMVRKYESEINIDYKSPELPVQVPGTPGYSPGRGFNIFGQSQSPTRA